MEFTDSQLVEKVIEGEISSFGVLIEKYERLVSAYAFAMITCPWIFAATSPSPCFRAIKAAA